MYEEDTSAVSLSKFTHITRDILEITTVDETLT